MKVAIVKYNAGNVESVSNALRRLNVEPIISDDAEILQTVDRVIFPGVGEASTAMNFLRESNLDAVIKNLQQPVLGVCLGMQLLGESSDENETDCLGLVPFRAKKFESQTLKVPHVGWNQIVNLKSELFKGIPESSFVYFVHSYFVENNDFTIASCDYAENFSAAIHYKNFYAVQFHTEKSGEIGAKILENFLNIEDSPN
ncbi:MAG: imidazole glycerol phosphate synthase subunit HisH [Pyrinomonadaceae bacterium]|nr:imidazole glycerol phosphate synthase subunit HisH [Pyrinomonadaceae bacterium]